MSLQPIFSNNREVTFSTYKSSLKTDYAAGSGTITIYSISQFAINLVLLIGEFGSEGSEIIKTHASTAPTGFTVTLASNTAKPHSKDEPVYILSFDQVEFSHADTLTGSKSVLGSIVNIDPEQDLTRIEDTTNTSGYYFTRYKNSITSVFSDYSDGIPYDGMPDNTVGYAIDTAMNELGTSFTERLTFGMLIGFAKQMLKLVRGKKYAWNRYKLYNQVIGTASQGVRSFTLPSDVYDQYSNKSILNLRIGNGFPLTPVDKDEYTVLTENVSYTEVATQAVSGDTSFVLDDTGDLEDTGSVDVFVSGTKYTVIYTANNKTTDTLTVASDQITTTIPVNSPVWQDLDDSGTKYYSVLDGNIYIYPTIESDDEGRNVLADYSTDIETIDSQMDVIKGVKYDMLLPYLKFKIRAINENSGKEDLKDPSYQEFRELLQDAMDNEPIPEGVSFRPGTKAINGGRSHNFKR